MGDGLVGEGQVGWGESGGLELLVDQETLGDLELLDLRIAGQAQDFHAVLQGLRDGVQHVGRADEHHLGEVVLHVQVMVGEGVIQLWVQYFHQRG